MGVWAKATKADTPKAVVEATGEGLRSETEGEVSISDEGNPGSDNTRGGPEQTFFENCSIWALGNDVLALEVTRNNQL